MLQLAIAGVVPFSLGITGEYLSLIFSESKHRPLYVIERCTNLDTLKTVERGMVVRGERNSPQSGRSLGHSQSVTA